MPNEPATPASKSKMLDGSRTGVGGGEGFTVGPLQLPGPSEPSRMFTPAEQQFTRMSSIPKPGPASFLNSRLPLDNTIDHAVILPFGPVAMYGVLPSKAAPNWSSNVELDGVKVNPADVKLYETIVSTVSRGVAHGKLDGRGAVNVIDPWSTTHPRQPESKDTVDSRPV